eukprot:IDg13915t1
MSRMLSIFCIARGSVEGSIFASHIPQQLYSWLSTPKAFFATICFQFQKNIPASDSDEAMLMSWASIIIAVLTNVTASKEILACSSVINPVNPVQLTSILPTGKCAHSFRTITPRRNDILLCSELMLSGR